MPTIILLLKMGSRVDEKELWDFRDKEVSGEWRSKEEAVTADSPQDNDRHEGPAARREHVTAFTGKADPFFYK